MQEKTIGFELAKLAKEKEFNLEVRTYFDFKKFRTEPLEFFNKIDANNFSHWDFDLNEKVNAGYISAPTQSLLQKWLREKHGIHIEIYFNRKKYCVTILGNNEVKDMGFEYKTYEEALEEGLFQALKLINNGN